MLDPITIITTGIALLFFCAVLAIMKRSQNSSYQDQLKDRIEQAKDQMLKAAQAQNISLFEQQKEKVLEVKLDDFLKKSSKKRGLSTGSLQKTLAGISTGQALLVYIACVAGITALLVVVVKLAMIKSLAVASVGGFAVAYMLLAKYQAKRENAFLDGFPMAFDIIGRGLKTGSSIEKTFQIVEQNTSGSVSKLFSRMNEEVNFGVPFEEALLNAAESIQIDDFSFFAIALIIQRQAGGGLSELIENIANFIRKRSELRMKVSALSSEAKATGIIVGALPVIILIIMNFVNPDHVAVFREDATGQKVGLFLICYLSLGLFVARRMTQIKF